jgi:quinol monooxygenase YgiN
VYGLIGQMIAVPGARVGLMAILLSMGEMPGCISYVVAEDPTNADAIWITEVWESAAAHEASLDLPSVQAAITKGRPLIADLRSRVETVPKGGIGLG